MQCTPNSLTYMKTNFFLHLVWNISKSGGKSCSVKKVLLEISQNSQENTCVWDSFYAILLKKSLWHRCFLVNFEKFLMTPLLTEHLRWLLLIYLPFWYLTLKIFCPSMMIKNIYKINQHWTGNCQIKCCPNKLIYIKALS